jgi:hypothetical protein
VDNGILDPEKLQEIGEIMSNKQQIGYFEFLNLFPKGKGNGAIIGYLHYMYNNDFVEILNKMSIGISQGSEYYGYNFPDVYDDPAEEGFFEVGVQFYVNNCIQVVSNQVYIQYLKIVCDEFKRHNSRLIKIVSELFEKIAQNLK